MRTLSKSLFIAATIALASASVSASSAAGRGTAVGWRVRQPTRFMVSGVLRKDGTTDVIKPVHAIVVAQASKAAVEQFSQSARREYPGYSLIATLASLVPSVGTCENSI